MLLPSHAFIYDFFSGSLYCAVQYSSHDVVYIYIGCIQKGWPFVSLSLAVLAFSHVCTAYPFSPYYVCGAAVASMIKTTSAIQILFLPSKHGVAIFREINNLLCHESYKGSLERKRMVQKHGFCGESAREMTYCIAFLLHRWASPNFLLGTRV